jgi:hypothetical protein
VVSWWLVELLGWCSWLNLVEFGWLVEFELVDLLNLVSWLLVGGFGWLNLVSWWVEI